MKKLLLILLIPIIILSTTACEKNNKNNPNKKDISIIDENNGFEVHLYYDKKEKYSKPVNNYLGNTKEITFYNKDSNLEYQMYFTTFKTDSYKISKETRKNQKYYGEYKFGKYKAYTYSNLDEVLYLNIYLDKKKDYGEIILYTTIKKIDNTKKETVKEMFDSKEVQNMFKTITYKLNSKQK